MTAELRRGTQRSDVVRRGARAGMEMLDSLEQYQFYGCEVSTSKPFTLPQRTSHILLVKQARHFIP